MFLAGHPHDLPESGFKKPISICSETDFPTPLRPRIQSVSPEFTKKLTRPSKHNEAAERFRYVLERDIRTQAYEFFVSGTASLPQPHSAAAACSMKLLHQAALRPADISGAVKRTSRSLGACVGTACSGVQASGRSGSCIWHGCLSCPSSILPEPSEGGSVACNTLEDISPKRRMSPIYYKELATPARDCLAVKAVTSSNPAAMRSFRLAILFFTMLTLENQRPLRIVPATSISEAGPADRRLPVLSSSPGVVCSAVLSVAYAALRTSGSVSPEQDGLQHRGNFELAAGKCLIDKRVERLVHQAHQRLRPADLPAQA